MQFQIVIWRCFSSVPFFYKFIYILTPEIINEYSIIYFWRLLNDSVCNVLPIRIIFNIHEIPAVLSFHHFLGGFFIMCKPVLMALYNAPIRMRGVISSNMAIFQDDNVGFQSFYFLYGRFINITDNKDICIICDRYQVRLLNSSKTKQMALDRCFSITKNKKNKDIKIA